MKKRNLLLMTLIAFCSCGVEEYRPSLDIGDIMYVGQISSYFDKDICKIYRSHGSINSDAFTVVTPKGKFFVGEVVEIQSLGVDIDTYKKQNE